MLKKGWTPCLEFDEVSVIKINLYDFFRLMKKNKMKAIRVIGIALDMRTSNAHVIINDPRKLLWLLLLLWALLFWSRHIHHHIIDIYVCVILIQPCICLGHGIRWGIFVERTAECRGTMMGGIGHCGSYQCLDALTLLKWWRRSMSANSNTQMHTYAAWHLITSATCSPWLLSSTNLMPPLPLEPSIQSCSYFSSSSHYNETPNLYFFSFSKSFFFLNKKCVTWSLLFTNVTVWIRRIPNSRLFKHKYKYDWAFGLILNKKMINWIF